MRKGIRLPAGDAVRFLDRKTGTRPGAPVFRGRLHALFLDACLPSFGLCFLIRAPLASFARSPDSSEHPSSIVLNAYVGPARTPTPRLMATRSRCRGSVLQPITQGLRPMTIDTDFTELKQRLKTIEDIEDAQKVLAWEQATYMPRGGAESRGRQIGLLSSLAHERLTDPAIGRLLDSVAPWAEAQGAESDEAALVRVARRDYDRATRVPSSFVHRLAEHSAATYNIWQQSRPANDFAAVRPLLEKTVVLSRELASFYAAQEHPFDPLIDRAEEG